MYEFVRRAAGRVERILFPFAPQAPLVPSNSFVIGSAAGVGLQVDGLAARHAELSVDAAGVVEVRDLSSGQLAIDGVPVSRGRLVPGAVLRLGAVELELRLVARALNTPAIDDAEGTGDTVNSGKATDQGAGRDAFAPGEVVAGRYRIIARLAQGGMGEVYQAEHIELSKPVAIKVMLESLSRDPHFANRFKAEAVAASRIGHPNIVDVLDFGQTADGRFFFAMEFLTGQTLGELVARRGALPVRRVVAVGLQVARALEAAHALGIVHRDLKPDNVMLVERGGRVDVVKVLDFGVAKVGPKTDGGPGGTAVGAVIGTPLYMAPEQAMGLPVDARADLYSLGLLLHELLTGTPTFAAPTSMQVLARQLDDAAAPLPTSVPPELRALVASLLEKAPAKRPASIAEVLAVLERVATVPEPKPPLLPKWALVTLGAVAVGLVVTVVDLSLDSSSGPTPSHEATPLVLPRPVPRPPSPPVVAPAPVDPVAPSPLAVEPAPPAPDAPQTVSVPANGRGTERAPDSPDTIVVAVGASVPVRIPGVTRVAVGDPAVADIAPTREGVTLSGRSAGYTNLLIWTRLGQTFRKVHVK